MSIEIVKYNLFPTFHCCFVWGYLPPHPPPLFFFILQKILKEEADGGISGTVTGSKKDVFW